MTMTAGHARLLLILCGHLSAMGCASMRLDGPAVDVSVRMFQGRRKYPAVATRTVEVLWFSRVTGYDFVTIGTIAICQTPDRHLGFSDSAVERKARVKAAWRGANVVVFQQMADANCTRSYYDDGTEESYEIPGRLFRGIVARRVE